MAEKTPSQSLAIVPAGRPAGPPWLSALGAAKGALNVLALGLGWSDRGSVDDYGKSSALTEQAAPLLDFLCDRYWRISIRGLEHLPRGPAVLVANHSGALPIDGAVVQHALSRHDPSLRSLRWLVEDEVLKAPILGPILNRLGAIPSNPQNALKLIADGRSALVFPEGMQGIRKPYRDRYRLRPLGRGGFAKIALRSQVPLVPVAIIGAEESLPLLAALPFRPFGLPYLPVTCPPLPAKWEIRIGERIAPPPSPADPKAVEASAQLVRASIESMLAQALRERGSAFF